MSRFPFVDNMRACCIVAVTVFVCYLFSKIIESKKYFVKSNGLEISSSSSLLCFAVSIRVTHSLSEAVVSTSSERFCFPRVCCLLECKVLQIYRPYRSVNILLHSLVHSFFLLSISTSIFCTLYDVIFLIGVHFCVHRRKEVFLSSFSERRTIFNLYKRRIGFN